MNLTVNTSVILLTYKSKILLMVKDYRPDKKMQMSWGMIESKNNEYESFLEAIVKKTKEEIKIQLVNVTFLFKIKQNHRIVHFFHGQLTDNNVNCIERKEGYEIRFFSLKEVMELQLEQDTNDFMNTYNNKLEELLNKAAI